MKKALILFLIALVTTVGLGLFSGAVAGCDGVTVSKALGVKDNCVGDNQTNPIIALIALAIQYATGVFGLVLVLMITIAGLQYVLAGDSPDTAKAAKDRLRNAATGLVLFMIMFGALQVLLPSDVKVFG